MRGTSRIEKPMSLRSTILSYGILSFAFGNLVVVYLLLRSLEVDDSYDLVIEKKGISMEFMTQISRGIILHKAKNYDGAVRICEQIQTNGLDNQQLHKIFLLKSICYQSAGLLATAMSNIEKSLSFKQTPFTYLVKGMLQEQKRELDAAIESYQTSVKLQPTYYIAHEKTGDIYLQKNDYKRALYHYYGKGAYREKDLPAPGMLKVALVHFRQGDNKTTLVRVHEYLEQTPQKIPAYWILGFVQDRLGNRQISRKNFRKAIQLSQEGEDLWLSKYYFAVFLARNREYEESEQVLKEILSTNLPKSKRKESRRLLANVVSSKGNCLEGIRTMLSLLHEGEYLIEDLYYTGMMYYTYSKYEESSKMFHTLHNTTKVGRYALSGYLLLAVMQAREGNFEQALKTLGEAKKKNGDLAEIRWMMGNLILRHNIREARSLIAKTFRGEKSIESRKMLADFYTRSGSYREAILLYEGLAEEIEKQNLWKLYRNLGDLYNKVGDLDKSISMYTKSVMYVPNDTERSKILNNMSYAVLVGHLDKKKSLQLLQEASQRSRDIPMLYYNLALFTKSTDWEEYARYMDLAIKGHTIVSDRKGRSLLYLEAGLYYRSKNQMEKSRRFFKMSLEYEPEVEATELEMAGPHI